MELKAIKIYAEDEPRLEALGKKILGSKTAGITAAKVIHWALNTLTNSKELPKPTKKNG
jgi:hypothetical protein